MDDLLLALGMLSRIKVPRIKKINYPRSTVYFSLVGMVAALVLFITHFCLSLIFQATLSRIISLGLYFLLFGYFHFDGLLDVIDGFFPSHKSSEERLIIMKDSNTGAFALLFGVLFLALEIFSILSVDIRWILFPVFGRLSAPLLLAFSKPATKKGLGQLYFPYPKRYAFFSLVFIIPILLVNPITIIFIPVQFLFTLIISRVAKQKINGINGDVIGFSIMMNELLFLLFLNVVFVSR
ncbi:MAG: adenosylcobinamide-GDP ribazoletransferase [Thermotogota bacterium]|nr:adenosylcobinamide-GDP ribazoletransferase [Thermotogota bacterium]